MSSPRAVFLDRDGVINRGLMVAGKPAAPRRIEDFRLLPGVADALARLKAAGFRLIVATNQPDIGNHLVASEVVEAMHERLLARLPLDEVRLCPHRQDEGCACRKPRPGMLLDAIQSQGIDPAASYMVGDRVGDMQAGAAAGVFPVFVDRGYAESRDRDNPARARVRSLPEAARLILARG